MARAAAKTKVAQKKVYLCGPMTGYPNFNFDAFNAAAKDLRDAGFNVINPAESHGGDQTLAWEEYLSWDLDQIRTCDLLVVLPGWQDPGATGARIEIPYAVAHSIPVHEFGWFVTDFVGPRLDTRDGSPRDFVKRITTGDNFGWVDPRVESKSALVEADSLINGPRRNDYDHPMENFGRIVRLWNALLHEKLHSPITEEEHAMMMMQVKQARLLHSPGHRDSYVDIAGYVGTYEMLAERRASEAAYHDALKGLIDSLHKEEEEE